MMIHGLIERGLDKKKIPWEKGENFFSNTDAHQTTYILAQKLYQSWGDTLRKGAGKHHSMNIYIYIRLDTTATPSMPRTCLPVYFCFFFFCDIEYDSTLVT